MKTLTNPPRPFGVSLAILAGILLYTVIPLFAAGSLLYLNNWIYTDAAGGITGISILRLPIESLIGYCLTAVFFLVLAVLAWRGKWQGMRVLFPLVTVIYAIFTLIALYNSSASPTLTTGLDSAMGARQQMNQAYAAAIVLITLYIGWFLNRWSARAFYRGKYTPQDLERLAAAEAAFDTTCQPPA